MVPDSEREREVYIMVRLRGTMTWRELRIELGDSLEDIERAVDALVARVPWLFKTRQGIRVPDGALGELFRSLRDNPWQPSAGRREIDRLIQLGAVKRVKVRGSTRYLYALCDESRPPPADAPLMADGEQLLAYILAHSGCTRRDIRVDLDLPEGSMQRMLAELLRRGAIRTRLWRGVRKYYRPI